MIKFTLTALIALFSLASGVSAECVRGSEKGLRVSWTAFKTPAKVGVKGFLREFSAEGPKRADSWQALVLGQILRFKAGPGSVDSSNQARDLKIAKFFFGKMKGDITAKVTGIDEKTKTLTLAVTMNGKLLENVSMAYTRAEDKLHAAGHIDLLDFGASKALASINKACFDLHQGKTWSHVEIGFDAKFKPCE